MKRSEARDKPPAAGEQTEGDLAGALHEVSNALTVVLGWLDAARTRTRDGAAREAIEVARAHADLGYRVARTAIGAGVGKSEARSAFSIAGEVVRGVTQEARRRGVRVLLDESHANDTMLAEGAAAQQILINLLLNAIAFTPVGGAVTLALRNEVARMILRVTDQGPGIEPERAETLFSAPTSTREGGAGIGLRYSAALARGRGGDLRLAHAGPGATFELIWPVEEARSMTRQRPPEPTTSLFGMRVLVVEDDAAVCSLIEFALDTHGIEVSTAASREQLVDLLQDRRRFDAALIDLSPFEEDAGQALALLEAAASDGASLILISGLVSKIPAELEGRITAWVRKPFEMNEVVQALQRVQRPDPGGETP